jgi:glutamyl-tRNA synthetase
MVRTRIAPSPTGDPHVGTAYIALFNYALAKRNRGKFILRIEDTDRTRLVPDAEQKIIDSLTWLGMGWDEGPFRQSERLELYREAAKKLVKKEAAYYCNCSSERLDKVRQGQQAKGEMPRYDRKCRLSPPKKGPFVIRLKVPKVGETSFNDSIRGKITFKNTDIDDAVILKSDGWPTYHLAVVVDDADMKITHVIRAEEWLSSTPKHVLLYQALGKKPPVFAHLPLLRNPDRSKISKRKNPVSLIWYKQQGYLPEAVLNHLSLMGWSMPDEKEKFTLSEFVRNFDLARVDPAGPVFDLRKLEWLNGEWIRSLSAEELADRLKGYTKASSSDMKRILPLVHERLKKLSEFDALTSYFFQNEIKLDRSQIVPKNHDFNTTVSMLQNVGRSLSKIEKWDSNAIERTLNQKPAELGWSKTDLFQTIRYAETASRGTPPLDETLETIGKEKTLERLGTAVELLSQRT